MRRISSFVLPALLLAACAGEDTTGPAAAEKATGHSSAHPRITVLMRGLDAPRQLAFGPEGGLYVAEAGTTEINGPCASVARGDNCYSGTGAVSRFWRGRQERVASGLPSTYVPAHLDIVGPQDIAFVNGRAFVTIGWGGDPADRAELGRLARGFGWVIRLTSDGEWRKVADIAAVEGRRNPAGGPVDANPYGLLAEPGRTFVADAGGNSLLRVGVHGVSVIATFPSTPAPAPFNQSDAVPTEVQRGPGGALFVSTLSGVPFASGAAKIYRVKPFEPPRLFADGFKTITDFTFGPDGALYVLEYASSPVFLDGPGRIVRLSRNGTRTFITSERFLNPTGILVDRNGVIYMSIRGNVEGVGQVLKIVP